MTTQHQHENEHNEMIKQSIIISIIIPSSSLQHDHEHNQVSHASYNDTHTTTDVTLGGART